MRIAVVGAGIIGLAVAFELLERGHDPVVVDPEPASGASHAAAGMLAAHSESEWAQDALHPLLRASAQAYPGFVARLMKAAGRSVGYRQTATLVVGVDAADRETLAAQAVLAGESALRMTGSAAREREPALGSAVTSAVLFADDHQVDPRQVTAALQHLLGERILRARVTQVAGDVGRVDVVVASGEHIAADRVVVAAGLSTSEIRGVPALPVRPVWGDILRLRVPEVQHPLLTHTVRALVHGRGVYLVPREDGTLVLGASVREAGVTGVQVGGVLALLRDAQQVLPAIEECEVVEMLARPRPASPDAAPLLGFVADRVLVAAGFDRHGVLLSPLAARLCADLIDGRAIDAATAAAIDPRRFAERLADPFADHRREPTRNHDREDQIR